MTGLIAYVVLLCLAASSDQRPAGTCPRLQADDSKAVLLPHRLNCSAFYICSWGAAVGLACPRGLHFNPRLQVCDWPAAAGCSAELEAQQHRPAEAAVVQHAPSTTSLRPRRTSSSAPVAAVPTSTAPAATSTFTPAGAPSTPTPVVISTHTSRTTPSAPSETTQSSLRPTTSSSDGIVTDSTTTHLSPAVSHVSLPASAKTAPTTAYPSLSPATKESAVGTEYPTQAPNADPTEYLTVQTERLTTY